MRELILICAAAIAGCSAPHAVRVRCDRHLTPINAPALNGRSGAGTEGFIGGSPFARQPTARPVAAAMDGVRP